MSAKTVNADLDAGYRSGGFVVGDPGASGTIEIEHKGIAICEVVTAAAESRVLESAVNFGVGQRLLVVFKTDGGDLTITGAQTDTVLNDAGEVAEFVVGLSGSTNVWRRVSDSRLTDAEVLLLQDADVKAASRGMEVMAQTALTDTATVTAAQLLTKIIDGDPTAAATYTLPTAALLVGAIPDVAVGDSFFFLVNNKDAAFVITVAAGAGGTADGTPLTVAVDAARLFLLTITNVTAAAEAYTVYSVT